MRRQIKRLPISSCSTFFRLQIIIILLFLGKTRPGNIKFNSAHKYIVRNGIEFKSSEHEFAAENVSFYEALVKEASRGLCQTGVKCL